MSLIENGKRVVYVSATTRDKRSAQISFEESAVLGEGSFGRVIKAYLRDGPKRTEVAIKTVIQDKRFKVRVPSRRFILDEVTFSSCRIASCSSCDR